MSIINYRDLEVWQKAMDLVAAVYGTTKTFPKEEIYGLVSQIRRSAVSIPSNIAEGQAKRSTRDFLRFINIAYGSAAEVETQLMISERIGYLSKPQLQLLLNDLSTIGRMLNGLSSQLEKRLAQHADH